MTQSSIFVQPTDADWVEAAPGVRRRMLGYHPNLMMVEVAFEPGAVGTLHSHPHIQTSYVAEGSFEMEIGGETTVLRKGDSYMVPADVVHGCKALEAGVLIDAFTPHRADFLD
ncbi:cupin domain-containing protein [Mariluticola halotolerans]|uniref:cupin domain-containing protein n=1 Tax=Mariluticola halotolerans TaxID=2909283 RepID=UPI0026E2D3F6|nr:cupin domain-containing protein [Mariluticola halotolerans]UJQ95531.1 cupin domain-containing protein [Mariluticola halotolerans]